MKNATAGGERVLSEPCLFAPIELPGKHDSGHIALGVGLCYYEIANKQGETTALAPLRRNTAGMGVRSKLPILAKETSGLRYKLPGVF